MATEIPSGIKFRVTRQCLAKRIEKKVVLVHMKHQRIHVLNESAATVWNLISKGCTVGEIRQFLLKQFRISEDQLLREIEGTIALLTREEFIEPQ